MSNIKNIWALSVASAVFVIFGMVFGGFVAGSARAASEKKEMISGRADVVITDDFVAKRAATDFFVTDVKTSKKYKIDLAGGTPPSMKTGDQISVQGVVTAGDIAATPADVQVISAAPATGQSTLAPSVPATMKKVAVIMFNFADNTSTPYTADEMRQRLFTTSGSADAFYQEASYGKMGLTSALRTDGDVFGWYTLPHNSVWCEGQYPQWTTEAETAAAADGFVRSNYTNVIHIFAPAAVNQCTIGGMGTLSGPDSWISTAGIGSVALGGVMMHEMGHNFGMLHATSQSCRDVNNMPVPISSNCTYMEYGDPFDVMGAVGVYGVHHFSNYHKGQADGVGWLDPANTLTIDPASAPDAVYTIAPIEQGSTGVQSLRIPYGIGPYNFGPLDYYLEYRQPYGFDSFAPTDSVTNGVTIRLAPPDYSTITRSMIIDTTADTTPNDFSDAALVVGKTFSDAVRGINVTTLGVSPAGATVRVFFTPTTCIPANPTLTITPTSTPSRTLQGTTVSFQYTLTDHDSLTCPSATFSVTPTMPSGWTQSPAIFSQTLAPGQIVARTFTVISPVSGYTSGNYPITETAVNIADATYQASAVTNYALYVDTTPPSVPTGLTGQVNPDGTVYLSWNASTDDIGTVGYRVYRNGVQVATTTGLYDYDPAFQYQSTNTYTVSAFDASGNVSAESTPTSVREIINLCTPASPTLTIAPTSTPPMPPGTAATYQFVLTSNDGPLCTAMQYQVVPTNLPSGWSESPSFYLGTLSPGQVATGTFTITSAASGYPSGNYSITELATNIQYGTYQAGSAANYTLAAPPDTTPPVIIISSPVDGTSYSNKKGGNIIVNVSATDASGIATMNIFMDGVLAKNCSGTTATPCSLAYAASALTVGVHVITVDAVDASPLGNTATPMVSVKVKR